MAEYNSYLYEATIPANIKVPEPTHARYRADTHYSDRSDVTAGLAVVYEGELRYIVSVHSRLALAEKKAKAENASETDPKKLWIAVPLTMKPRNLTYFSGAWYGNAEPMAVFDTSEWTMEMWSMLRYRAETEILAKHFDEGVHEFENKKTWRGRKMLELPICKFCNLLREELYIR